MISHLTGKIIFKGEKFIILDVRGVGYKVFLSQKALSKIPKIGKSLKLFCFLDIRRNTMDLYGFSNLKELEFFRFLNEVPSIGSKSALEVASIAPMEKVKEAIEKDNKKIIEEILDVGKKKGQRIILELSREIKKAKPQRKIEKDEVYQALRNLGFSPREIKQALSKISKTVKTTEQKIKEALTILGK